jgi:hypothetical protein
MRINMKKIIYFSLIFAILFITAAVIVKRNMSDKKTISEQINPKNEIVTTETDKNKQQLNTQSTLKKKIKFRSNEEIKEEYGKIETVHLWNGKVYTGAVVNSQELYSIVTVNGTIKIPMKDVKLREIIK